MNHTRTIGLLRRVTVVLLVLIVWQHACHAGKRGPGKYSGVVVFDRWDACTLYSGIYLMYVSEKVKEGLRQYKGQAVEIDASEVEQVVNPGDGLIRAFTYLGPARDNPRANAVSGLTLKASIEPGENGKGAIAVISVEHLGKEGIDIHTGDLAPTLLTKLKQANAGSFRQSDGPSYALVTRQAIQVGPGDYREKRDLSDMPFSMTIRAETGAAQVLHLQPGDKRRLQIEFELPDGEYEFLCGLWRRGSPVAVHSQQSVSLRYQSRRRDYSGCAPQKMTDTVQEREPRSARLTLEANSQRWRRVASERALMEDFRDCSAVDAPLSPASPPNRG